MTMDIIDSPRPDHDPLYCGADELLSFLVTVKSHQLRGLTFGHYVTNPHTTPDHVLVRASVSRATDGTNLQHDFHRLVPVGPSLLARWEGHDLAHPCRDVLVVSGELQQILFCDQFARSFAHAVFDVAEFGLRVGRFAG